MPDYNPRVKSELLRCMLALCLSDNNGYSRAYRSLTPEEKNNLRQKLRLPPRTEVTKVLFGVARNTLSDSTLLPDKGINRTTLVSLVEAMQSFRQRLLEIQPQSDLAELTPVDWNDFDPEVLSHIDREEHVYAFGLKLGFSLKSATGQTIWDGDRIAIDRMAIIQAIDQEKNTADKPGCGVNLYSAQATKLYDRYAGVYALYYPAGYHDGKADGYFMSAIRVSHVLERRSSRAAVIRAKLNVPNVATPSARYQYRGYLSPIGHKDHLSFSFHLATNTINREIMVPNEPSLDPDVVSIITGKMLGTEHIFRGLLTSLSQRLHGYSRVPYAAKVLLKKQEFHGSRENQNKLEANFMRSDGLGYFSTIDDLCSAVGSLKEAEVIRRYFNNDSGDPSLIFSEAFV